MCAQISLNRVRFVAYYPFPDIKWDTVERSLGDFIHDFGTPENLTFDNTLVQLVEKKNLNTFFGKITSIVIYHHHKDQIIIQLVIISIKPSIVFIK